MIDKKVRQQRDTKEAEKVLREAERRARPVTVLRTTVADLAKQKSNTKKKCKTSSLDRTEDRELCQRCISRQKVSTWGCKQSYRKLSVTSQE